MRSNLKTCLNFLCLLPFLGLLSSVFILDKNLMQGTGSGKVLGFYIAMGLIPLTTFISYLNNRQSLKYCCVDLLFPLFAGIGILISYIHQPYFNTKMITLVLMVVLYFCLRIFFVQRKANLNMLLQVFMITGLVEAIWGLLQLYDFIPSQHHLYKITGSFFNPGPYAGYLSIVLPIAFYYFIRTWNIVNTKLKKGIIGYYLHWGLALATITFTLLILPATMSRGAWIAAIISCLFIWILHILNRANKGLTLLTYIKIYKNKTIALFLVVVFLSGICLGGLYYLKKDSADGRALIWKISLRIIDNNLFGVGIGKFSGEYGEEQANYLASYRATDQEKLLAGEPEYAFNEFIQICVEFGIIPLIILIGIFSFTIQFGIRIRRKAEVGSLISLLVFSFMSYPLNLLSFVVVCVLLLSACVSKSYKFTYVNDLKNVFIFDFQTRYRWNKILTLSLLITSFAVAAYCLYFRYPVYLAHKEWSKARLFYYSGSYPQAVVRYEKLLPYLQDDVHYLFEYGQSLFRASKYKESIEIISKATLISGDPMLYIILGKNYTTIHKYEYAQYCFEKAARMVPHRLYPYYLLSKLYSETGEIDKAKKMAEYVLNKSVKVDSPAIQKMKEEMKIFINNM
jgi:tetratricopeptide (TPR) repeat protein